VPTDDFPQVFDHQFTLNQWPQSENPFTVDARATHLNPRTFGLDCCNLLGLGGDRTSGFFGHGKKFGMLDRMGACACVRACARETGL
jgi:hypothetical protein